MGEMVTIVSEESNSSRWIKVYIPATVNGKSRACIQDKQGAILKRLTLHNGHNAIDISCIQENPISIKVETPYETILKEIVQN